MKKLEWKQALLVAVFFGGFQALMPTIGWVLGKQFEQYIVSVTTGSPSSFWPISAGR